MTLSASEVPKPGTAVPGPFASGNVTAADIAQQEAQNAAKANAACDAVLAGLPPLGKEVTDALDRLKSDIAQLIAVAQKYDDFAQRASHELRTVGGDSQRVRLDTRGPTVVDRIALRSCHADRHLAALIAPAMRTLGAPDFSFAQMTMLAEAAPEIVQ